MKPIIFVLAALLAYNVSLAQVQTAVKEGAKATGEKAQQLGDQAKGAVSTQPTKSISNAKANVHKAKAHAHSHNAKEAAKEVPK
jgi:Cu/Ag efflux pump CusA